MNKADELTVRSITSFRFRMNFFGRLKLVSIFFFISLLITGAIGLFVAQKSIKALQDVFEKRMVPAVYLSNILTNSQRNYEVLLRLVNAAEAEKIDSVYLEYRKNKEEIEQDLLKYKDLAVSSNERELVQKFETKKTAYEKDGLGPVFERIDAVKDSAIPRAEWSSAATLLLGKGTQDMEVMIASIRELIAIQSEGAKLDYETTRSFQAKGMAALLLVFIAATVSVLLMGTSMVRSLSATLGGNPEDVRDIALRISKGDLTFELTGAGKHKGSLMGAMAQVREELSAMVMRIREASSALVNASSEISQNNLDLSSRTEYQANELQHTTAGMEDLTTIVQRSAASAQRAVLQANSASEIAREGGDVVADVISTMKEIKTSSNRISEIINVIDGIAFQTNILALNAAVESARAGEQGRGFAVVANEVRSLAKRSATAAKEIKTLIGDSVKCVDTGTGLVDKAGATMTEVVAAIRNVSEIMATIGNSSAEQEGKVALVKDAIIQIDAMTQQNAALAEQMAAATLELNKLASDQFSTVEAFKVSDAHASGFAVLS